MGMTRVSVNSMRSNVMQSDPGDRAKSAAATVAIHIALGAALLTGLALHTKRGTDDGLKTFDVTEPLPPPPRIFEAPDRPVRDQPAPAGRKAEPSPIMGPPARIPTPQPIAAAPVAGSGSSADAGAAASGSGTGAGGAGQGDGGGSGGIGTEARLLSGNRGRLPSQLLRSFAADRGYAHLFLTVGSNGRVVACDVMQGTGNAAVDQALCQVMLRHSRWSAARDRLGRPMAVQVRYTATWSK